MAIKLDANECQLLIAEYQNNLAYTGCYTSDEARYAEARVAKLKQELRKALYSDAYEHH